MPFPEHNVGGAGSVDERLGLVALALPYTAPESLTTDAEQITWCATFQPDPLPVAVPIVRREFRQTEGGRWETVLFFEGHPDADDPGFAPLGDEPEEFEMEGALDELAIETHPNLPTLLSHYEGTVNNNRAEFPEELSEADGNGDPFKNPMFGVDQWRSPGLVWSRHFIVKLFPAQLISQLGKIAATVPGDPPKLWGKRVWLLERIAAQYRGNVWKVSMSWRMSGPGGVVLEMFDYGD